MVAMIIVYRFCLIVCMLGLTGLEVSCESAESGKQAPFSAQIDSLLVSGNSFNGVIYIQQKGNSPYEKVLGFSDWEQKIPLETEDQFVIGSVSKQITAVMILQAYEQGKLTLHIPIRSYLPALSQTWADTITVHHLLTHTHGISDLESPLVFRPSTQFQYSQLGYELLAQIHEQVSGNSFANNAARLFEQCGMKQSSHPDLAPKRLVKGYAEASDDSLIFAPNSLANYVAAGGFISTAADLSRWNEYLHGGKLLADSTFQLMITRYATRQHPIFGEIEYGYGVLFKKGESAIQIGALGYAPGFVSACYYFPKNQTSVVVLENIARDLDDFRETFDEHLEILNLVKQGG